MPTKNIDSENELNKSIATIKGVGDKLSSYLAKLDIVTLSDIIFRPPFRYELISSYDNLSEKGVLIGIYESAGVINTKQGKRMLRVVLKRDNDCVAGIWLNFNNNYPLPLLSKGKKYAFYGAVSNYKNTLTIFHPEILSNFEDNTVRSIYHTSANITQQQYRKILNDAIKLGLSSITDNLPSYILDRYNFPPIVDALQTIHTPKSLDNAKLIMERKHIALKRLIYEELFYLQLLLAIRRRSYNEQIGIKFDIDKHYLEDIKEIMPFKLTSSQRKVIVEIFNDMSKPTQMNRLIEGDVGSGKSVLAFISGAVAIKNGYQTVILAPTEVLAEQHFHNLTRFFEKRKDIHIAIITGSVKKKDKDEVKLLIQSGDINFIVGTHALLEDNVEFKNLGLVIVDEQHRFGVEQRKKLIKKGETPDILLMSATPIPRTLAMTLYGDLDLSTIDELPPNRLKPITKLFPANRLNNALEEVREVLKRNERAFFVYPLIDESDKTDVKAATQSYDYIRKYYKDKKVGLLHGRLKSDEKRKLLSEFKDGRLDILVSTTVIEVGVDISEATVMVIENADMFGLAQLHQLRGRVGRSNLQAYCFLIASQDISDSGKERLKAMVDYTDGFKLAEIDLKLRGSGDLFGVRQSGEIKLKYANIILDIDILKSARADAEEYLKSGKLDEVIESNIKSMLTNERSYVNIG